MRLAGKAKGARSAKSESGADQNGEAWGMTEGVSVNRSKPEGRVSGGEHRSVLHITYRSKKMRTEM